MQHFGGSSSLIDRFFNEIRLLARWHGRGGAPDLLRHARRFNDELMTSLRAVFNGVGQR